MLDHEKVEISDSKENIFLDRNIMLGIQPKSSETSLAQHSAQPKKVGVTVPGNQAKPYTNLDEQFSNFLKKGGKKHTFTSSSLKDFGDAIEVLDQSTPKGKTRGGPQVMKNITDIVKRSKS